VGKRKAAQGSFKDAAQIDYKVIQTWLKTAKTDVFDSRARFKRLREEQNGKP
jgi:hypothetical protein